MQWIEVTIKTAPGAIDLVCDRLTVLGFDSFIVDDQDQFHEFLEENRQYWDYVDEGLEQQMQGSRRSGCIWRRARPCRRPSAI